MPTGPALPDQPSHRIAPTSGLTGFETCPCARGTVLPKKNSVKSVAVGLALSIFRASAHALESLKKFRGFLGMNSIPNVAGRDYPSKAGRSYRSRGPRLPVRSTFFLSELLVKLLDGSDQIEPHLTETEKASPRLRAD